MTNAIGDVPTYVNARTGFIVSIEPEKLTSELRAIVQLGKMHAVELKRNLEESNPLSPERWALSLDIFFRNVAQNGRV